VTSPVDEIMNDARISTKFDFAGTHDFSFGYYIAKIDQGLQSLLVTVLLDVQNIRACSTWSRWMRTATWWVR